MDEEKKNGSEQAAESAAPVSRLEARFVAPGSVLFQLSYENVNPVQLLAFANYIKIMAELQVQQQIAGEAQRQVALKPGLLVPRAAVRH